MDDMFILVWTSSLPLHTTPLFIKKECKYIKMLSFFRWLGSRVVGQMLRKGLPHNNALQCRHVENVFDIWFFWVFGYTGKRKIRHVIAL